MTANERPTEPPADATPQGDEAVEATAPAKPTVAAGTDDAARAGTDLDLGDRMGALGREAAAAGERFGREAQVAGERLGREAQAAGERLRRDPAIAGAASTASRAWGAIVLAIGLWFFADVTLGLSMPSLAWRELWPIVLIVIGLFVVVRGLARRA